VNTDLFAVPTELIDPSVFLMEPSFVAENGQTQTLAGYLLIGPADGTGGEEKIGFKSGFKAWSSDSGSASSNKYYSEDSGLLQYITFADSAVALAVSATTMAAVVNLSF